MKLNIITPTENYSKDVDWIELNSTSGNFVILDDHAPMILNLISGSNVVYGLKTGKQESLKFIRSLVHVKRESVTFLGEL